MSSMVRNTIASALVMLGFLSSPAWAQDSHPDGREWDAARAEHRETPAGIMAQAIARWKLLNASDQFRFDDYSSFVLTYPGFPEEAKLRIRAEQALEREGVEPSRIAAFFDRFPPLTNPGRARYALALAALGRSEAREVGRAAWRGGPMNDVVEASLLAQLAPILLPQDHDARMDALLWASAGAQAERQLLYVTPAARAGFLTRLGLVNGRDPAAAGLPQPTDLSTAPGYLYNRARMLRTSGQTATAAALLASRPPLTERPLDPRRWIAELLAVARKADARSAARIAAGIDDAFAPGTDVSLQAFAIRDDYTSLMWLGGTKALRELGDGATAAPLFYRYGTAARTAQTRSKGFYWAGRASMQAGRMDDAERYFQAAAAYPDQYYGMLALERLGRPLSIQASSPSVVPTASERAAFEARPLTQAVREAARETDWPATVRFFKEIAEQAESESDHVLVVNLAQEMGRRDLAVILGQAAHTDGHGVFRKTSFPLIPIPPAGNWTMIHAISRQESQFAMNAISHAGARGLMQLMPGTAREQAGKLGLLYDATALTRDAGYNLTLGDAYFRRMLAYYNGSYPLAVAAYNAGPGNVNKWLAANGDPRRFDADWVDWIERIPLSETRGYVQRVLENAVVYEALYPARATQRGPNPLSGFLGKRDPG